MPFEILSFQSGNKIAIQDYFDMVISFYCSLSLKILFNVEIFVGCIDLQYRFSFFSATLECSCSGCRDQRLGARKHGSAHDGTLGYQLLCTVLMKPMNTTNDNLKHIPCLVPKSRLRLTLRSITFRHHSYNN